MDLAVGASSWSGTATAQCISGLSPFPRWFGIAVSVQKSRWGICIISAKNAVKVVVKGAQDARELPGPWRGASPCCCCWRSAWPD